MRTDCCGVMASGQCKDCPLTTPRRPPITLFMCWPSKCEHDYSTAAGIELPDGGWTAICVKCGSYAAALAQPPMEPTQAAREVLAERARQVNVEGWTHQHDDTHRDGHLAKAAACYASHAGYNNANYIEAYRDTRPPLGWPWDMRFWKPTDPRRDLVKAGALILAEIERIDRAAPAPAAEPAPERLTGGQVAELLHSATVTPAPAAELAPGDPQPHPDLVAKVVASLHGEHRSGLIERLGGAQKMLDAGQPVSSWVAAQIEKEAAVALVVLSDAIEARVREIAQLQELTGQGIHCERAALIRAGQAERRAEALATALVELVACKTLKDRADAIHEGLATTEEWRDKLRLNTEYQQRKPMAWAKAFGLVDALERKP